MPATKNEQYERSMREKALINHVMNQQRAIEKGRAGTVAPYGGLVRQLLTAAETVLEERLKRGRGRSLAGVQALRQTGLDLRTVCAIGARTVVDGVVAGHRVQRITVYVGGRIEDEVRVREFAEREPRLWKNLKQQFDERASEDYKARRAMTMTALLKARSEEQWTPWDVKTKAELGLLICDALEKVGLLVRRERSANQALVKHQIFDFPPEIHEALEQRDEAVQEILKPWFKPMLEEPLDWTSPTSGGYMLLPSLLVKIHTKDAMSRFDGANMPKVYAALNAVQRTPWKINEDVLVVAEELHRQRTAGIEGLPVLAEAVKPERPPEIPYEIPIKDLSEEDQVRLRAYLHEKRKWHNEKAKRSSRNVQALQILEIAREVRAEPRIYFPHNLDYRGRMYPLPLQLNPQGNDLAKGLLTFAEGRPLGDMGGFWLAVHGANTWGNDKGPLADRVDWVLEHEEEIRAVAADPLSNMWWTQADGGGKPFQFLAFCLEWSAYLDSGESPEFVSHLPVSVDGACNGIQHFSAMLRDPSGARATNLTSDPVQHDVYSEVAEEVNELIRADLHGSSAVDREMAGIWLKFGVDRKVVKRPVMTTPYGATAIGMKDMVLEDTIEKNKDAYFGAQPWQAAQWLAAKIDQAIGSKLVAARQAMNFLQELTAVLAKQNQALAWTSPSGFPVVQYIRNMSKFVIDTQLLGRIKLAYVVDGKRLDKAKQRSASAPNFVHSYDAAHLQLTVVAMEEQLEAPVSWAVVHDSFGTHAGLAENLGKVLREEFVRMYTERDPLVELREAAERSVPIGTVLPQVPPLGCFDLTEVLTAEFFFA